MKQKFIFTQKSITFVHASEFIFEYSQFVDFAKFFKHRSQISLLQISGNLTDEQFNCFSFFMSDDVNQLASVIIHSGYIGSGGHPRMW